MKKQLTVIVLLLVFVIVAQGSVVHHPPIYRGTADWLNLYPGGAAQIWQHWDSTFVDLNTGAGKPNSEHRTLFPRTDGDSLFSPTLTKISSIADTTFVMFYYTLKSRAVCKDDTTNNGYRGLMILSGEVWPVTILWDSIWVWTDSASVRVDVEGHPEW